MQIVLFAMSGSLYFRDREGVEQILVHRYPEGDADTIPWPIPSTKLGRVKSQIMDQLTGAMYGARECGEIHPKVDTYVLPDGRPVAF